MLVQNRAQLIDEEATKEPAGLTRAPRAIPTVEPGMLIVRKPWALSETPLGRSEPASNPIFSRARSFKKVIHILNRCARRRTLGYALQGRLVGEALRRYLAPGIAAQCHGKRRTSGNHGA